MEIGARRSVLVVGLALATIGAVPHAMPPKPPAASVASTKDFRIETDESHSNINTGEFSMPHHVKFFRPGTDVVGDSAKGNFKAGTVTITGHVVLHDDGGSAEAQQAGAAPGGGPSTLECDVLQVDSKRKIYIASGNVRYVQGQRRATAASGKLDQPAHALDLSGDVHLADGDETLSAPAVHYDTLTKDVSTSGSTILNGKSPGGAAPPAAGTMSTLPTPAAKATPKPK